MAIGLPALGFTKLGEGSASKERLRYKQGNVELCSRILPSAARNREKSV